MANLALADLIAPYLLRGENLGINHAALSVIRVTRFETAADDFGTVIRGSAEFDGRGLFDPAGGLKIIGKNEASPPFDPDKRDAVFDWDETSIDFELFVPREGSLIIGDGAGSISSGLSQLLDVWDQLPVDPPPSDYPSSGFTLDLILNAPSVRPPFMHPAKMDDRGLLVADSTVKEVALVLPRLRFRMAHGNERGSQLSFQLVSLGSSGLDDPGDIGIADLIEMKPPYALFGDKEVFGMGFRRAVLDLSNDTTPPEVVEKFGFGDDWGGLYLPELRIFFAPDWKNLAFEASVTDLLIGFNGGHGVSGDFELDVIRQGGGDLVLGARFFDANGKAYGIQMSSKTEATVALPAKTRMVIDVQGGMPPYITKLSVVEHDDDSDQDGEPSDPQAGRLFNIEFNGLDHTRSKLIITATDSSSGTAKTATLTIKASLLTPQQTLPKPGDSSTGPNKRATVDNSAIDPNIIILFENSDRTQVTLSTDPQNSHLMWSVVDPPGGAESGPSTTFDLPLAPGESKTVRARLPALSVAPTRTFYFKLNSPPKPVSTQDPNSFAAFIGDVSGTPARSTVAGDGFEPGGQAPFEADRQAIDAVATPQSPITVGIKGDASVENDGSDAITNYHLAHRRAMVVRAGLEALHQGRLTYVIDPEPDNPSDYPTLDAWKTEWSGHTGSVTQRREHWSATVTLPAGLSHPEKHGDRTVTRPASDTLPADPKVNDPPAPHEPPPPSWFRSAKLKLRIVQDALVAGEVDMEIDLRTAAEERVTASGQVPGGAEPPPGHTLQNGTPLGSDNPSDGITQFRFLVQKDQATGTLSVTVQFGADPADKDGLFAMGWLPGQTMPPNKDVWLTLAGSYLSFWPMLVDFSDGNQGGLVDASLSSASLAIPGAIALIPWFRVERVILFGGEALEQGGPGGAEGYFLFDIEADWSADISIGGHDLIRIDREFPLAVRYKAIGLHFGDDGSDTTSFPLRPVFDASRGFTIDVARGGSIHVADPFSKFLKILAARLSRTNPLTFEVDIGCGVDLGVVSIDRARLRVYLEDPVRPPELTALGASIDVPGAIAGSGYLEIGPGDVPNTSKISGQIDVTIRPISLRVAAAFEIQDVTDPNSGRSATAVYVGLNVVLPVGIPLANSGLGIFGFRGIFGMHYARNATLGGNTAAPALGWLRSSEGQPHLIRSPTQHNILWQPQIDNWAFGVGTLIGTMEGGVIINMDGTLILELPGPRIAVVMNMRIISPPPSVDQMGNSGGILAIIEITPDHLLIGAILNYNIESLIKIEVPVESFFNFHDASDWHYYLGQRSNPVSVSVLDIIKATGYLMLKGNGLDALPERNLPAVTGFAIGAGAAASFTWGDTDIGLYLRVAGGFDAVIGFDPFLLAGEFSLSGELRLFIVSVGASAELDIQVVGQTDGFSTYINGKACGHVDFFFFSVEGCVSITINDPNDKPGLPDLVQKLSLKSRSPALLVGTGVDRPIDTSLGEGVEQDNAPAGNDPRLPVVPIDSVVVLSMAMPPVAAGLTFAGGPVMGSTGVAPGSFVPRGSENFEYVVTGVTLERADGGPALLGSNAPAVWWTPGDASSDNVNAQLALLTWEPDPATKAVEKTEYRKEQIKDHWSRTCEDAAPPTRVLWTFLHERLGPSVPGWDLEGVAWPDPPNTRRKQPPVTDMLVTEAWRSGDPAIDAMRGILPATVVGATIRCTHSIGLAPPVTNIRTLLDRLLNRVQFRTTLGRRLQALLAPPAASRVARLAAMPDVRPTPRLLEKIALIDPIPSTANPVAVAKMIAGGGAVTRQQIGAAFMAPPVAAFPAVPVPTCQTRVLQSPIFDDGRLIVFGDPKDREVVKEALDKAGVKHGPLNDVVVIHTGAFQDANILLFVRRALLIGDVMIVRTLAADGTEMSRVPLRDSDLVSAKPLPGAWTDFAGPWGADVADVLGWSQDARSVGYMAVWITAKGGEKADRIEIGLIDSAKNEKEAAAISQEMGLVPPYYLAAFDTLTFAEIRRADSEETEILKERAILTQILGPGPTDDAYLVPDKLYKVTTSWTGTRQSDNASAGKTQVFWFRSDAVAPARLDPWVLLTNPADGEANAFRLEPVQIVFNTHNVDRLFGAYGKELRVRFTASSANHPKPTPGVPHPFPLNDQTIKPAAAAILSPWEEALEEVVTEDGLTCIPIDEDRVRQTETTIQIPLDPFTDYRMDVVMVDTGAPDNAEGTRIYRRSFSTGSYDTLKHFASDLGASPISHRAVEAGRIEALRAFFGGRRPEGAELDEQLRIAGIDAPEHAPGGRFLILWEQTGADPPQPAAILVDAPEPMWRSRPYPRKVTDTTGPVDATRWVLGSRDWLELQTGAGTDAVIAADGFIRAPGDQRVLVVLGAGSRGKHLRLDLVRTANTDPYLPIAEERFTVVDVVLVRAPWEE